MPIAVVIAIPSPRPYVSHVTLPQGASTAGAGSIPTRRPLIHEHEFHNVGTSLRSAPVWTFASRPPEVRP